MFRTTQKVTVCHNLENKSVITQLWGAYIPQGLHINYTGPNADKAWLLIWLKISTNQ